jgi:transposase
VPLRVQLKQLMGTDLMCIPGIGEQTALVLFTEVGPDLSRFPNSAHFASWLGLCPKNKISGGKVISSSTGPGANRAAQALRWATQTLFRSQSSLGRYFRRLRARVGTPAAIVATAHKLARIIYRLITDRVDYKEDKITETEHQDRQRFERRVRNQARLLGYKLVPQGA